MVNDELPQGRIKILIQKVKQFLKDRPLIRGMDCFSLREAFSFKQTAVVSPDIVGAGL
jgi:hypothetical protein